MELGVFLAHVLPGLVGITAGAANVPEGFAAGAMAHMTLDELIPESRAHGNRGAAMLALIAGFGIMWGLELFAC